MKNCPFCAEDIQDKAIKCKHCGEWLSAPLETQPQETGNDASENLDESLGINALVAKGEESTEGNSVADDIEVSNDPPEIIYSPLHQTPKWGWGWVILFALFVPGLKQMHGVSDFANAMIMLITIISPIVLLSFYFWNRRRIIRNNKIHNKNYNKIWLMSLWAGVESYIIVLIITVISYSFVQFQDRKYNNIFFTQFSNKALSIKNDDDALKASINNNIENHKKPNEIVFELNKYYQIINRKKELLNELFEYADKYNSKLNKNDVTANTIKIRLVSAELFKKHEDSIESLISYYNTGNDNLYKKYTKLTSETAALESEYQSLSGDLLRQIQFQDRANR